MTSAACAGAMYYRLPNDVTAGVYNRVASLWFVGMVVVFMSGNSALTIAYTQKPLLRREVYAGHYSYLPYYVAKTVTTLPLQVAYTTLYVCMTYFLVSPLPLMPSSCLLLRCIPSGGARSAHAGANDDGSGSLCLGEQHHQQAGQVGGDILANSETLCL